MKPKKITFALVVAALAIILGTGFFVPRVSVYIPMVGAALALLLVAAVFSGRSFSIIRSGGLALLCGGPVLLSGLANGAAPDRLIAPTAFLFFAIAAYWVGRSMQPGDLMRASTRASAIAVGLMGLAVVVRHWDLVAAIRTGNREFADPNQFITGMNPTVIGLMAMAIFLAALASRSLRFVAAVLAATGIVVMAASSRSALMAMLVAAGASRYLLRKRGAGVILLGALGGVFLLLIGLSFFGDALQGVANALFLVEDQHRGIGSGGSGRSLVWSFFYQNWLSHPIFGSGPGTMFQISGNSLYSHNMLLQILTDGGLVSLATFVVVIVAAVAASRRVGADERRIFLTTLLAYLVYGIFEGRAINIGNPMSAYFYFALFTTFGMTEGVAPARAAAAAPHRLRPTKWEAIGVDVARPRRPLA